MSDFDPWFGIANYRRPGHCRWGDNPGGDAAMKIILERGPSTPQTGLNDVYELHIDVLLQLLEAGIANAIESMQSGYALDDPYTIRAAAVDVLDTLDEVTPCV